MRSKESQCKEKAQFLQDEVANNQDLEEQIKRASRDVARVKVEFQQAEKQRDEFQSEVCNMLTLMVAQGMGRMHRIVGADPRSDIGEHSPH